MKSKYIAIAALAISAGLTACDDDKQLTLDAPETKLLESITLEVSDVLPLPVGMDSTITYTWGPEDADDPTVVFSSSDESVATVDQNGTIKAVKVGQAVITAQTALGFQVYDAVASVQVDVIPELVKVSKINLSNSTPVGEDGFIYVTDEIQLAAEILPADATYTRLVWHSADESIATVDQTGKVLCVKEGIAKIYATATDRTGVQAEYTFEIKKYIAATGISIKPLDGPVCISYGAFALEATYEPTGATVGSVEWTSDNEGIAAVRRGIVTPTGFGTCNITAKCLENGASASVTVTVEPGFYVLDPSTNYGRFICSDGEKPNTNGVNGTWRVKVPLGSNNKWRRDIKIDCNNNNTFEMRLKSYPVFAIRMTKLNGGNATGDIVELNKGGAGNPNPKNGIDLGDGTQLLIYNLGTRPAYEGLDQALFRVFQFKIADIPLENMTDATSFYDVYWARTFKSEDEAKAFAEAQVARGE